MKPKSNLPDSSPPLDMQSTFQRFLHHDAMAAVFLLLATGSAFYLANSSIEIQGKPLYKWYQDLWHIEIGGYIHGKVIAKSLHHLINDGLMAIFFFMVGLEIKRELLVGELASVRKALFPIAAAIGGMVCPALIYAAFNHGTESALGWGIPMATDIAFAAGVLGLLSKRVPSSLAVFLIALAIVDDLGSVTVIAVFYTDTIALRPLVVGMIMIGFSFFLSKIGVRNALVYTIMFILIWLEFFQSGVHATIAGVLFAFSIPVDARYETPLFVKRLKKLLTRFSEAEDHANELLVNSRQQDLIRSIEAECIHVEAPLQRIEHKLHPISAFIIMPIFAFANSGIHMDFNKIGEVINQNVTYGVILGLLAGKQIGIMGACWITVKAGLAELPRGISWLQLYGVSWLAGIGFTMSLFIGSLAFPSAHIGGHNGLDGGIAHMETLLAGCKLGILLASILAAIVGTIILLITSPQKEELQVDESQQLHL